jgi:hypothetical protein
VTQAFAVRAASRLGIAVSVVRIIPVAYSPETACTARIATAAWLNWIPLRASFTPS